MNVLETTKIRKADVAKTDASTIGRTSIFILCQSMFNGSCANTITIPLVANRYPICELENPRKSDTYTDIGVIS